MYREAKGFVNGELDRRSTAAGQQVNASASHLRTIADQLRGDDLGRPAASYVDQGASALEQVATYLQDSDGDKLLADAESFGKERPWAVAAAGFLVGLGISRMVKAGVAEHANSDAGSSVTVGSSNVGSSGASASASGSRGPAPTYAKSGAQGSATTPIASDAAPLRAKKNTGSTAP